MADSSSDEELSVALVAAMIHRRHCRKRPKKLWVRSIFAKRKEQGEYHNLLQEMRLSDVDSHFRYIRMSRQRFDVLVSLVRSIWYMYNLYQCN